MESAEFNALIRDARKHLRMAMTRYAKASGRDVSELYEHLDVLPGRDAPKRLEQLMLYGRPKPVRYTRPRGRPTRSLEQRKVMLCRMAAGNIRDGAELLGAAKSTLGRALRSIEPHQRKWLEAECHRVLTEPQDVRAQRLARMLARAGALPCPVEERAYKRFWERQAELSQKYLGSSGTGRRQLSANPSTVPPAAK